MTESTAESTIETPVAAYNPFEPGFAEDPYPFYRAVRETDPVHRTPLEFWVLFSYDDVMRFLRDPALSVEDANARPGPLTAMAQEILGDEEGPRRSAMLNRDPPDHTRLRGLVSKAFTPRVIEGLRPRIEALVAERLDAMATGNEGDLISELAFPLPFSVISEMLGIPEGDSDQLRAWSGLLVRTLEPVVDPTLMMAIAEAGEAMTAHVSELLAWKRAHPGDDLLSALIAAEEHGDVLSDDELLAQVLLLYIAGHETTVNLIGNGTLALLRHPEQLRRLHATPELLPNAVEELLRYDSPVQMSRRITLADVEVGGTTIEAGTFVALGLASANRDRAHWGDDADELDLGRDGAGHHVSFGGGAHYCLGAALARLEGQVAIGQLVARFPGIELAGEPAWNGRLNLRGLDRLPVRLAP